MKGLECMQRGISNRGADIEAFKEVSFEVFFWNTSVVGSVADSFMMN